MVYFFCEMQQSPLLYEETDDELYGNILVTIREEPKYSNSTWILNGICVFYQKSKDGCDYI
jgi:hypothetical protein